MRPGIVSLCALIASISAHPISLTQVTRVHLNLLDDVLANTFKIDHGQGEGMSGHRSEPAKHSTQSLLSERHHSVPFDEDPRISGTLLESSLSECNVLFHENSASDKQGTISLKSLERLISSLLIVSITSRDGSSHDSSNLLSPTSQTPQCREILSEMSRRLRSHLILSPNRSIDRAAPPKKVLLTSSSRFRNEHHDHLTTSCHVPERPYPRHRSSWDSLAIVAVVFLAVRLLALCVEYLDCLNTEVDLKAKAHGQREDEEVEKDVVSKDTMVSNDGQADSAVQYDLVPLPEYVE